MSESATYSAKRGIISIEYGASLLMPKRLFTSFRIAIYRTMGCITNRNDDSEPSHTPPCHSFAKEIAAMMATIGLKYHNAGL
jgi:hypothetical protein